MFAIDCSYAGGCFTKFQLFLFLKVRKYNDFCFNSRLLLAALRLCTLVCLLLVNNAYTANVQIF